MAGASVARGPRVGRGGERQLPLVELTAKGRKVWDGATGAQAREEALVASALSEKEKELNALLRRRMLAFD